MPERAGGQERARGFVLGDVEEDLPDDEEWTEMVKRPKVLTERGEHLLGDFCPCAGICED